MSRLFHPFIKLLLCRSSRICGLSQYIDSIGVLLDIIEHIFCWIFNYKVAISLTICGVFTVSEWNDKVGMLDQ